MKPPPFAYAVPRTVDQTLALLAGAPDDTSLLAGGQSLVPLLNMRLARPTNVVDLNRVEGLGSIEAANGTVRIGSMVRQRTLETDPLVQERLPLVREAVSHAGHLAIRTRGTIGGSLAHADPAAELPTTMVALGARMVVRRATGNDRVVPAAAFFLGPLTTAVEPGELLTAVEIDAPPAGTGWAFLEVARVHGAFALVGVAALVRTDAGGHIDAASLALCGVGGAPYSPPGLDEMVRGEAPGETLFGAVGDRVAGSIDPPSDNHAGAEYRRRVAGVLTRRALALAARRADAGAGR
ncbi:MAG: FAD binding domain-containing protein [Actinomycetota bacterium]